MGVQTEEIQLRIVASGNAAKKELADLAQVQDDLKRKIDGLDKKSKDYASTKRKLSAELQQTNERMRKLRSEIDLNSMSMRDLRNRANDLKRVMDNMKPNTPEWNRLNGQLQETNARMRELSGSTQQMGGTWGKMMNAVKGGILAFAGIQGVRMLWQGAKDAVAAYTTQAQAVAKVNQAITSTAGAAGLSLEQLRQEALNLQKKTLFGDETILNDATAQLLTFTNIANDNFLRTQRVALDLSTVLDGDLKSASIQLGKALNDPVANLSALSDSGIQFSAAQKDVIKELAETNRLAEAQGVILDELERQYGGQAEAAVTAGGAWKQLGNLWVDLSENMGRMFNNMSNMFLPELRKMMEYFIEITDVSPVDEIRTLNREFNIQMETLKTGNLSVENRARLIDDINKKYGDYLPNLLSEKSTLDDLKIAQDAANVSFNNKINMMAAEEALQTVRKKQIDNEVEALKLQEMMQRRIMEVEEARTSGSQNRNKEGINRELSFAEQRLRETQRAIEDNAAASATLTDEFNVVSAAAMKFGISIDTNATPTLKKATAAISKAKDDLKALQELIGTSDANGTAAFQGGDVIQTDPNADIKLEIKDRAYLHTQLWELNRTAEELELEAAGAYYDELAALAGKYGGDTELIETKRQAKMAAIKKKYADTNKKVEEITLQQGLSSLSGALDQVEGLLAGNAEAMRSFGLFKLAIDTATSISSAIAGATQAAAATGPGAPFTLAAYIASMIATVDGSFVKAKKLMSGADAPKFADGGVLSGPSHSAGGMAVVDQYGNKQAEVEGGEAILPVNTTAANLPFIQYMLANPGKTVMPTPSVNIDTSSLNTSISGAPRFANGGTMPSAPSYGSTSSAADSGMLAELRKLTAAVLVDKDRRAVVSIQQFTDKQEDLDTIRKFSDIRSS